MLMINGCSKEQNRSDEKPKTDTSSTIAYVNGDPVTNDELELMRSRLTVNENRIDSGLDKKIIDSLINSRAMSVLAKNEMGSDELNSLQTKVDMYREELLVKEYLRKHVQPTQVLEKEIVDYYLSHQEEFSGGVRKTFEYFETTEVLTGTERKKVLDFYAKLTSKTNWKEMSMQNKLHVKYRKAKVRTSVLEDPLKALVINTKKSDVSSVHIGEQIIVAHVIDEEQIPALPLNDVRAEIRKKIAPIHLRKAIAQASEQALKQVKVTYPHEETN